MSALGSEPEPPITAGSEGSLLNILLWHMGISIYTSICSFSLEGDIKGCFYSPRQPLPALLYLLHPCSRLPNLLQQERELSQLASHCIYDAKKLCRYLWQMGEYDSTGLAVMVGHGVTVVAFCKSVKVTGRLRYSAIAGSSSLPPSKVLSANWNTCTVTVTISLVWFLVYGMQHDMSFLKKVRV